MDKLLTSDLETFRTELRDLLTTANEISHGLESKSHARSAHDKENGFDVGLLRTFVGEVEQGRIAAERSLVSIADQACELLARMGEPCSECASAGSDHIGQSCRVCRQVVCARCLPFHTLRDHPYFDLEIAAALWEGRKLIADPARFCGPVWAHDEEGKYDDPMSANAVAWSALGAVTIALGGFTGCYRSAKSTLESAAWRLYRESLFDVESRRGHRGVMELFDACLSHFEEMPLSDWERRRPHLISCSPAKALPTVVEHMEKTLTESPSRS